MPNTLAQMGDIKANKEKLAKALEFAKKNPDSPDSIELRRRLERGMFNMELQALGKKPFPVQQPKIDLKAAMAGVTPAPMSTVPEPEKPGRFMETLGDVGQTAVGAAKQVAGGVEGLYDIATNDEMNLSQKFAATSGELAGTAAGIIGELTIGAGKALLPQEGEDMVKSLTEKVATAVSETEAAKSVAQWYQDLSPNNKVIVDSLGGIAALITEVIGLKGAKVASKVVEESAVANAPKIVAGAETVVDVAKQGVDKTADLVQKAVTPSPEEVTKRIDDAVGRILQGTPDDIAAGRRALQQIDTTGIEDYAGLNTRITETTKNLANKVDTELDKYPDVIPKIGWVKTTKVGDELVLETPVMDALDGLENAYTLSGELPEAARIRQLRTKLESDGLTLKEANDIAREYGMEFRDRAFTKLGDPKPGYGAENFENVRIGVKRAVREKMPDTTTKELDAQMSDLYATKILTEKMEVNVQKLYQKVKNRTLMQKAGGAAADIVDLVSLGTMRGFVQKILPSNVGLKTANSLDLQKELAKNLATIEKLNKIEDPKAFAIAFEKYLKEDLPVGMSIRSTVTPLKVGKEMTEKEFDLMADAIEDIGLARSNPDFNDMLKKHGLSNAEDEELVKFMKDATDQFERPETAID